MKIAYMSFSDRGFELAQSLSEKLGGTAYRAGEIKGSADLREWTKDHFSEEDAIIFVGAMGIAVRTIAPFIKSKASDPAVVVIDEKALYVIPILSGHLGGANDLTRKIADITGSDCVITTATDINDVFAVDEWSKRQNCVLMEPHRIVGISARLLNGEKVSLYSRWPVTGQVPNGIRLAVAPENADIVLDIYDSHNDSLHLVPKICVLGVGCKKGTAAETIEQRLAEFIDRTGISINAIKSVATIDFKKDEPGLIEFCRNHGWNLLTFSGEELKNVQGSFISSEFVRSVAGVDNVCERSAVCASEGELLACKTSGSGVTLALASEDFEPNWKWRD